VNGLTLVALIVLAIGIGVAWRAGVIHGIAARLPRAARARAAMPTLDSTSPRHSASAERTQLLAFAEDRRRLFGELADARSETARYRQIVVDIERNAPPPLLDAPGTPDDLKLIVGIGPVIERMLYQMGIASYRQIARWSERDIDDVDARLREFPGRIRRDGWVTQARALHAGKYGTAP
jgi:predicted flap endonuclease-1-like 5' DNA nuclease